jgi:hypothetical protein
MRSLKVLLAVTAIGGMAALPQTSSAGAVRPDTKAEDFSYYGGGYYAYDDYYPGPHYPAPYYEPDYYHYPRAYHPYPHYPAPVPFIGLGFGFGRGHWDD